MSEDITHQLPNNGFKVILARFDSMETAINSRMDSFEVRLVSLEEKVDRRLMETRPIWEQVLERLEGVDIRLEGIDGHLGGFGARFDGLDARLDGMETRLAGVELKVETRLGKVEHELYGLGKKFRLFHQEILDSQNAHEDLEERVTELEKPRAT